MAIEITVRELYDLTRSGSAFEKDQLDTVFLQGWVRMTDAGNHCFFLSDGTCEEFACIRMMPLSSDLVTGMAVSLIGTYEAQPEGFLIRAAQLFPEGGVNAGLFLDSRKTAACRVASSLTMAVHEFFQSQGFTEISEGLADPETLTVNYRDVYACRPDNGRWHVAMAMAFADADDGMDLLADFVQYCLAYVNENCPRELCLLADRSDQCLRISRMTSVHIPRSAPQETSLEPLRMLLPDADGTYVLEIGDCRFSGQVLRRNEEYSCTFMDIEMDDLLHCMY